MPVGLRIVFFTIILLLGAGDLNAAVVLQYHHVGEDTPRSTSVSEKELKEHIYWLRKNQFKIIPLTDLVNHVQSGTLDELEKIAAISFDDAGSSVCEAAWPILKRYNIPFTVFVNTDLLDKKGACSWRQLEKMFSSGLLTVGNHGHDHANLVDLYLNLPETERKKAIETDIKTAEAIIEEKLGRKPSLFAYPYGEYNSFIQKLVKRLGYIAFGQHSGAVGNDSDLTALPRFPLSGRYAELEGLADKLFSLPFSIERLEVKDTLIVGSGNHNPPKLDIVFKKPLVSPVRCFLSTGQEIDVTVIGELMIRAQSPMRLEQGRHKYNCTSYSGIDTRYFWFSQLWIVVDGL